MYNPSIRGAEQAFHASRGERFLRGIRDRATAANVIGLIGATITLICLLGIHTDPWNIRIPLYLMVVVWTILCPRVALYFLPFTIPWDALDTFSPGGTGYDSDILVALLATGWLLGFVLRPLLARNSRLPGVLDREPLNTPWYLILSLGLLLFAMILSTTVAFSISTSMKEIAKWIEVLLIIVVGAQYLRTRRQIWTLVVLLCLAALTQAGLGFTQEFFNQGPSAFVRDASLRVYGTFGQPNPFAGYINMTLSIAIALVLLGKNWATRILAACVALPLACVEFFTQSKGGWIAIVAALIFIVVVGFPLLRWIMGSLGIAVLGVIGAYLAGKVPARLIDPILIKVGAIGISFTQPTPDNYANSERVAHWVAGINMFLDHPFFGVGMGNYQYSYPHYKQGIFVIPLGHAHNYYINIAAEAGIFGLITFLLFLVILFVLGTRSYRTIAQRYSHLKAQFAKPAAGLSTAIVRQMRRRLGLLTNDRALAIGLLAALISVCVHNLVDNLYVHSMASLFALLFVILIRLDQVKSPS